VLATLVRKNLVARPLRYLLTGLSIVFGVASVVAVFIFTDGLRTTFDELSGNIEQGYDIAIRADSPFGDNLTRPAVPTDVLDDVAGVEGVVAVQPRIIDFGIVAIDSLDEARTANGPNIGLNWESRTPNPRLFVTEGREPTAPNEFAIDVDGFEGGEFEVGDTYRVITPAGSIEMELVGTFNFADAEQNSAVGAIIIAFEEEYALEIINGGEGYDDLTVVVEGDAADVLPRITPLLDAREGTLVAEDQSVLVEETQEGFGQILTIFQTILIVFAAIILLVSAFLIFNVFTITLGQRVRELGLLRSIGAFGSQVTNMMLGEALILGIAATIIGIPAGWGLSYLLRFGLSQAGFPGDTGLPINPTTLLYAVLVGVVVTLLAAFFPSMRARRVTPMTALREGGLAEADEAVDTPLGIAGVLIGALCLIASFWQGSWWALLVGPTLGAALIWLGLRRISSFGGRIAGFALLFAGLALLTVVRFASLDVAPTFGLLGAGALITIVGASLVSSLVAAPAARMLGYPFPLAVVVGLLGVVAGGGAIFLIGSGIRELVSGNVEGASVLVICVIAGLATVGLAVLAQRLLAKRREGRVTMGSGLRLVLLIGGGLAWIAAVGAGLTTVGTAAGGLASAISDDAWLGSIPIALIVLAPVAWGLTRTAWGSVDLTGRLARDNAARNPSRTATTATALMIGLALVSAVTVIGDSIKTSVTDALGNSITADWFIQGPASGPTGVPFSTEVADRVMGLEGIDLVVPYRFTFGGFVSAVGADADEVVDALPELFAAIGGEDTAAVEQLVTSLGVEEFAIDDVLGADFATVLDHIEPRFVDRDASVPVDQSIWIEDGLAEDRGLVLGDTFPIVFLDGQVEEVTVAGIYEDGFVFGERVIDMSLWERHLPDDTYGFVTATTSDGVLADAARTELEAALSDDYPLLTIQDSAEVQADAEAQINQTLAVVNILLLLSAGIAVLGIAIALSLAVFERTREIGLLRAVGTTRQQTRWMIRWEGVIVAAFGGVIGVVIGIGLGVLATQKMPEFLVTATSFPIWQLLGYVVLAALTGLGAGAFPAFIAGRMNVLDAISNE